MQYMGSSLSICLVSADRQQEHGGVFPQLAMVGAARGGDQRCGRRLGRGVGAAGAGPGRHVHQHDV